MRSVFWRRAERKAVRKADHAEIDFRDRYDRSVVSLAVLRDSNRQFRPVSYADGRWGCRILFELPMVKWIDYVESKR